MNEQRLLTLADALETRIPAEHFDLELWRYRPPTEAELEADSQGEEDLEHLEHSDGDPRVSCDVPDEHLLNMDCGTAGCAVGWATALPEFKAEGFIWKHETPQFGSHTSWDAVEHFFDIPHGIAKHLFMCRYYSNAERKDPLAVAARIRHVVEHGHEEAGD